MLPPCVSRALRERLNSTSPTPLDATALLHACAGSDLIVHAAGLTRAADERAFIDVNVNGTRAAVGATNGKSRAIAAATARSRESSRPNSPSQGESR